MKEYKYITLKEEPTIKELAAEWFHNKWGVPTEAYLECMDGNFCVWCKAMVSIETCKN